MRYIYIIRVLIYCIYICILCIHKLGNTCYNDSQVLLTLLVTLFGPKTGTFFLHVKLAATNWANPGSVTVLYFFAINWSDLLSKISNYMAKINISKIWVLYFFAININWLSHLVGVFWLVPRILKYQSGFNANPTTLVMDVAFLQCGGQYRSYGRVGENSPQCLVCQCLPWLWKEDEIIYSWMNVHAYINIEVAEDKCEQTRWPCFLLVLSSTMHVFFSMLLCTNNELTPKIAGQFIYIGTVY